jgi:hypothetical protein
VARAVRAWDIMMCTARDESERENEHWKNRGPVGRRNRAAANARDVRRTHRVFISYRVVIVVVVAIVVGAFEHRRGDTAGARVHTHLVGVFTLGSIDCAAVCERVRANVGKTGQGAGLSAERSGLAARRRAIPRRPIADDDDNAD